MPKAVKPQPLTTTDDILNQNSILWLTGEINTDNITEVCKAILARQYDKTRTDPIRLFINSVGGDLTDAFGLIDLMRSSSVEIHTYAIGQVLSSAFLIFISGKRGHRYIGQNATCMIHQFHNTVEGKYHELMAKKKDLDLTNEKMINVLLHGGSFNKEFIQNNFMNHEDYYFSIEEMIDYGFADVIF